MRILTCKSTIFISVIKDLFLLFSQVSWQKMLKNVPKSFPVPIQRAGMILFAPLQRAAKPSERPKKGREICDYILSISRSGPDERSSESSKGTTESKFDQCHSVHVYGKYRKSIRQYGYSFCIYRSVTNRKLCSYAELPIDFIIAL